MPSKFPDLDKVWKMEMKSGKMVKSLESFFKPTTTALEVKFLRFGQILFNLVRMFAAHHEKRFVPASFKVSIDHLVDNLECGKKKLLFWKNV